MKGPYNYEPKNESLLDKYSPYVLGAAALLLFYVLVYFIYISSYNSAMVACLAEHSKDVCVETLR